DPDPQKTGKPTKTPRVAHSVPPKHAPISPPSRSRKASTIPLSTYDAGSPFALLRRQSAALVRSHQRAPGRRHHRSVSGR
ncbi:GM19475, partial [Drosophila sechellia]